MPKASYSTAGFYRQPLDPALDAVAGAGFECVELSGCGSTTEDWHCESRPDAPHAPRGADAAAFRRAAEQRGLAVTTLHAPANTNVLGPPTDDWRREKVDVLASYLRFAGEIGAAGMVVHGIPNVIFLPKGADIAALLAPMVDAMKRSMDDLVPVAAEAGVRILLENLPYVHDFEGEYPLVRMGQLRPFADGYPPDQVGLIVDTGHAWTNGDDPVSEIRIAGDRLWGTHIQDVPLENPQDNHWMPTAGGLDWPAIRQALASVDYRGTWTFEISNSLAGETPAQLAASTRQVARSWGL
jgi:L-ribulose-5-phosphate 3-epimerase